MSVRMYVYTLVIGVLAPVYRLVTVILKASSIQVAFYKKKPIERSAATTAAADDADVSQ